MNSYGACCSSFARCFITSDLAYLGNLNEIVSQSQLCVYQIMLVETIDGTSLLL